MLNEWKTVTWKIRKGTAVLWSTTLHRSALKTLFKKDGGKEKIFKWWRRSFNPRGSGYEIWWRINGSESKKNATSGAKINIRSFIIADGWVLGWCFSAWCSQAAWVWFVMNLF